MRSSLRHFGLLLIACLSLFLPHRACAGDIKLKAQLVWGTDDSHPPDKNYLPLNPTLREKVRLLRWKNYFVVQSTNVATLAKSEKKVDLSERCSLNIKDMGNGLIDISIFNPKGKKPLEAVKTEQISVEKLKQGHAWIFGGDSKDRWDDAWLVFITIGE